MYKGFESGPCCKQNYFEITDFRITNLNKKWLVQRQIVNEKVKDIMFRIKKAEKAFDTGVVTLELLRIHLIKIL